MRKYLGIGLVFFLLFLFAISSCIVSNYVREFTFEGKKMLETIILPNGEFLKRASIGYSNLFADLLWIRTIRYVYLHGNGDKLYPELPKFFQVITDLDPNFKDIYRIGGEMIRELSHEPMESLSFLSKGLEIFPEEWPIVYEMGRSYLQAKNWEKATRSFESALHMPGAPPWLSIHVADGYYRMGEYQKSLAWWVRIAQTTGSGEIRVQANSKAMFIVALMGAQKIASKSSEFYAKFQRLPENPEELIKNGFLDSYPEEPFGGKYIINKKELTVTTNFLDDLLKKCFDQINPQTIKYKDKYGRYPFNYKELGKDSDLGKKLPDNPYGGDYIFDPITNKFRSSINYLAKIVIPTS